MEVAVGRKGVSMNIAKSAAPPAPLITFIKGIGGCALIALCFSGAIVTGLKLPFGFAAQFLATIVGGLIGGALTWYAGRPSPQE
jgi:hypothetical protein